MLKSALIPLDGSECSEAAIQYGIQLAKRREATLAGLGIVDTPTITAGAMAPIGGASFKHDRDEKLLEDARKKAKEFISHFEAECQKAGVTNRASSLEGLPFEVINHESRYHDLIVIGRETCFHFETADAPGETLGQLMQGAARPLVIVPPKFGGGDATLIAVDDGTCAARSVQMFAQLEHAREYPVHVVAVDADEQRAKEWAAATGHYLRVHGYVVHEVPRVTSNRPSAEILEQAKQLKVGSIVVGPHSRHSLKDLFFGSTATEVIKAAEVPVFVYP
jgi:nucleotide-binding universal stress UspA family protein